jgi:3-hydroxyacyl-CoA dehydrogenase
VAPAVGELQLRPGERADHAHARFGCGHRQPEAHAPERSQRRCAKNAVARAARTALAALAAQGVAADVLAAGIKGWLSVAVPEASGQGRLTRAEVTQRVLAAMAAEGARLLAAGAVRRASDIDALAVAALGMPRAFGGPMFRADRRGLLLLRRDLQVWQADHAVWAPHPMIDGLLSDGRGFADSEG